MNRSAQSHGFIGIDIRVRKHFEKLAYKAADNGAFGGSAYQYNLVDIRQAYVRIGQTALYRLTDPFQKITAGFLIFGQINLQFIGLLVDTAAHHGYALVRKAQLALFGLLVDMTQCLLIEREAIQLRVFVKEHGL